ncbi:hypothetical protein N657DRAFT_642133 [Parathielavia appendiculata]|uniref:Uncharacterized protein n=1 Tax=Parathielavia appendiculata TaxID=2587402 RepID=A0AAN6U2S5_9PEZI|nr:hypothetical protein N657DRAFT_642133 [Parathielavia appendiculata]
MNSNHQVIPPTRSVPFNDSLSDIRLIKLLPGHDGDPIAMQLFVTDRGCDEYEALSSAWGSRDAEVSVRVGREPFRGFGEFG